MSAITPVDCACGSSAWEVDHFVGYSESTGIPWPPVKQVFCSACGTCGPVMSMTEDASAKTNAILAWNAMQAEKKGNTP